MTCEHLRALEEELIAAGHQVQYRGSPWSRNCREWVYFDVVLDTDAIRKRMSFAACVKVHSHRGTHDGAEHGFECAEHHDAVMGIHPSRFETLPGAHPAMVEYERKRREEKTYR
jgi:hypothetical protein